MPGRSCNAHHGRHLGGGDLIIGIDLGTTNCACALWRHGAVHLIPNSLGHLLTPSAVSVDADGQILTGLEARERQSTHPERTVTAFKRYMGTARRTELAGRAFLPEELSALLLRRLKADAEAHLGEPVTEAVITVPAYFNDKQRKATRRAGALAGLKVERLINEPTAAALAHSIHQRDAEARFLVFDLGGGTFDVSIVELFEGVIEVRASAGDNRLGGEDFNEVLIEMARTRFAASIGRSDREDERFYQKLREAAERTRRALTDQASAELAFTWKGQSYQMQVDLDAFETACEGLIKRMREPLLRSLRDSGVSLDSLNEIVLVGGATRMPVVRKAVTRMFGRFPATNINPDEAVARGAAVQAGLKARDAALREVVLTDVCPFTLGVETVETGPGGRVVEGVFAPILERNVVIPASRERAFWTVTDNQSIVSVRVFQGESRWVRDNIALGEISTPVPKGKAGDVRVDCRFTYDINGLLEVDVHVPATGARRNLLIVDKETVGQEDLEARRAELAALKVHPRDTDAIRATLARAGRCYENSIGELRETISRLISEFEFTLERQDPRACEAAREELSRTLDRIEGEGLL